MLSPRAKALKDWLQAYVAFEERLDDEFFTLRKLEAEMDVRATVISDMPKSFGTATDMMSGYVSRKEQLVAHIGDDISKHDKDKEYILEMMTELEPIERFAIRLRYIGGLHWGEIIRKAFGRLEGFDAHNEMYSRRIYRAHDSGLEKMAKKW